MSIFYLKMSFSYFSCLSHLIPSFIFLCAWFFYFYRFKAMCLAF
ncbi:putative membrane protein [Synechococcus sp. A15-62]|nr:putative membrane protein [Synechococcus sp. A15-62]